MHLKHLQYRPSLGLWIWLVLLMQSDWNSWVMSRAASGDIKDGKRGSFALHVFIKITSMKSSSYFCHWPCRWFYMKNMSTKHPPLEHLHHHNWHVSLFHPAKQTTQGRRTGLGRWIGVNQMYRNILLGWYWSTHWSSRCSNSWVNLQQPTFIHPEKVDRLSPPPDAQWDGTFRNGCMLLWHICHRPINFPVPKIEACDIIVGTRFL